MARRRAKTRKMASPYFYCETISNSRVLQLPRDDAPGFTYRAFCKGKAKDQACFSPWRRRSTAQEFDHFEHINRFLRFIESGVAARAASTSAGQIKNGGDFE
jgi:hypothetical protein